ncbi:MAG: translocation/assembly module TamB domain-containing protein [Bacteroidota bacterium]
MAKKILRITAWIFGSIIGLFLLIWIAIQIPAVQNKIVQQVTQSLSETLDTKVEIERVSIKFFKTLALKGIYVEDQQQDTLVYAKEIGVNIGLLKLFSNHIHVNEVYLRGATSKLYRSEADSLFNYQFIIDAFATETPPNTTASTTVWTFGIDEVSIQDTYFRMLDEYGYTDTEVQIEDFEVQISALDLEEQLLDVNMIRLRDSRFRYSFLRVDGGRGTEDDGRLDDGRETRNDLTGDATLTDTAASESLVFPDLGWKLYLNRLSLENNTVIFDDENAQRVENAVDFAHLDASEINLELRDWQMTPDLIKGRIRDFSLSEQSGFRLEEISTKFQVTPQQITIDQFKVETPKSDFQATAKVQYTEFSDLVGNLEQDVHLNLDINNGQLAYEDLNYFAPSITEIKELNTQLDKTINFSGNANGTLTNLNTVQLNIAVDNDLIFSANGSANQLMNPDLLSYNIQLQELSTSYDKLKNLTQNVEIPSGLDSLGTFQLLGNFQGNMNAITGKNIQLRTDVYTGFKGDLKANHLTDDQPIAFDLDIIEMRTQANDLNGFVEGGLPPEVARLGKLQYRGKISGDAYDIISKGILTSDAGKLNTNAEVVFNRDYSDARYNGELALQNFDLGYVLQDTTIGEVSFEVSGNGSGLSPDSIIAEVNGVVQEFDYQNYEYKNLRINGNINKQQFVGTANFNDPNLAFDFQGDVNLNDSLPEFDFTASVDTINLTNLNFQDIPYAFSGDIYADFDGNNLDNINGAASIQNIYISNDSAFVQTDSIVLTAREVDTGKRLNLRSEFFSLLVEGQYDLVELPAVLTNFVNDYFPLDQTMSPVDRPDSLAIKPNEPAAQLPDQSFTALLQLDDPVPLVNIFSAGLEQLDTAFLSLKLDTKAKDLSLQSRVPKVAFQGTFIKNIALQASGTPALLESSLTTEDIDYGASEPISLLSLEANLGNDSLGLYLKANEGEDYTKVALGGNATKVNRNYRFAFDRNFILNNETWKVKSNNEILYRSNYLDVNDFSIRKGEQALSIRAEDGARDEDIAPLRVGFQNFELEEIFKLINMTKADYSGKINGSFTLRDYTNNLNYLADMSINDIILEEQAVGDLSVKAKQDGQRPIIDIEAVLKGEQSDFSAKGNYGIESGAINLNANLNSLQLRLLDPFMFGLVEESKGTLSGNFDISGESTAPNIEGNLVLDSISTILGLSGVRYTINQEEIRFENGKMDFGETNLVDQNGYRATLSGTLGIDDFNDISMDLNFQTRRFQVLNTTSQDEELYYGNLVVAADVDINGTANNPVLNMRASTLSPSQLYVQPLTIETAVASQRDYIIFANPEEYLAEDSTHTLDQVYQLNESGIDLILNLEVTPDAELQIIIDPATGDKLVCRGNAEMTVKMDPTGEVNVLGNYQITRGNYALNYQGLLKKDFRIRSGSRLDFVGDPLDTRFDITAIYTTQTPTFELIRNQIQDETSAEALAAKKRSEVNVLLSMAGDLDEPIISFDIQVPESGNVTSTTRQAVERLRETPNELNKQVFSLLLLNSFIAQQSGGGNLADAGASVYLSSVSSLLTNQLNRLAENYIKGVDINIGVDSYQSQYDLGDSGNTITELNLGVSKQFFNDRLSVQVGGNVNVNSQSALLVEGANFSSIAGDFVLEYKLTEEGTYRLRVFRRDNFDVLNQDNAPQTGVGLSFRKSFGDINKGKEEKSEKEKEKVVGTKEEEKF